MKRNKYKFVFTLKGIDFSYTIKFKAESLEEATKMLERLISQYAYELENIVQVKKLN